MKKKQRGQKRKLEQLKRYLQKQTGTFPEHERLMDHWHMPCSESFLNSSKTCGKIKTQAMQTMIDCAVNLYNLKSVSAKDSKVFVMLSMPDLWNSQILLFLNPSENEYYKKFFNRNSSEQTFSPLENIHFAEQRNLQLPPFFKAKSYKWHVSDPDKLEAEYQTTLHFFGEFE